MILDGTKLIESRLTVTVREPFGQVTPGEVIHFKRSSGPFVATAVASRVLMAELSSERDVQALFKQYGKWIGVDNDYWKQKRRARYATLIWLRDVQPSNAAPRYRTLHMRAWYVLDDAAGPVDDGRFQVELTDGGARRGYAIVRSVMDRLPARGEVTLVPDGGDPFKPCFDRGKKMLRGAAMRDWLAAGSLGCGDRLEFQPLGRHRFAVRPIRKR